MLCKLKDRAAAEDKNSIVYDNNYSNCEAVYFGKSLKWTQLICQDLRLQKEWYCETLLGSILQL